MPDGDSRSPVRLSPAQRRHLSELQEIALKNRGEAFWNPKNSGERACALALEKRGYLRRDFFATGGRGFEITDSGRETDT